MILQVRCYHIPVTGAAQLKGSLVAQYDEGSQSHCAMQVLAAQHTFNMSLSGCTEISITSACNCIPADPDGQNTDKHELVKLLHSLRNSNL